MARKPRQSHSYKTVTPRTFSCLRRLWLRIVAGWAYHTTAGSRSLPFRDPFRKNLQAFDEVFTENAVAFGAFVLGKWGIPKDVKRLLAALGGAQPPFLHLRSVFSNSRGWLWWPWGYAPSKLTQIDPDQWYDPATKRMQWAPETAMRKQRFNIRASALVAATGSRLVPKLTTSAVYRDYLSEPTQACSEETQFSEGWDLPRRFRTTAPEMPLALNGGRKAAPRFVVLTCVENTGSEPVFLISARDLIERLGEVEKQRLRAGDFTFFDNWNPVTLWRTRTNPKAILYDVPSGENPGISFDANRIDPAALESSEQKRTAVLHVMERFRYLEQHGGVYRVVLRAGDALVIDNYRTLVLGPETGRIRVYWGTTIRWLRAFHGYSHEPE